MAAVGPGGGGGRRPLRRRHGPLPAAQRGARRAGRLAARRRARRGRRRSLAVDAAAPRRPAHRLADRRRRRVRDDRGGLQRRQGHLPPLLRLPARARSPRRSSAPGVAVVAAGRSAARIAGAAARRRRRGDRAGRAARRPGPARRGSPPLHRRGRRWPRRSRSRPAATARVRGDRARRRRSPRCWSPRRRGRPRRSATRRAARSRRAGPASAGGIGGGGPGGSRRRRVAARPVAAARPARRQPLGRRGGMAGGRVGGDAEPHRGAVPTPRRTAAARSRSPASRARRGSIIASGADVAALGGFSGRESEVASSWLASAVARRSRSAGCSPTARRRHARRPRRLQRADGRGAAVLPRRLARRGRAPRGPRAPRARRRAQARSTTARATRRSSARRGAGRERPRPPPAGRHRRAGVQRAARAARLDPPPARRALRAASRSRGGSSSPTTPAPTRRRASPRRWRPSCRASSCSRLPEKGRGRALRAAWSASDADVVCYMDVDLSTDLRALLPLARAAGLRAQRRRHRDAPGARRPRRPRPQARADLARLQPPAARHARRPLLRRAVRLQGGPRRRRPPAAARRARRGLVLRHRAARPRPARGPAHPRGARRLGRRPGLARRRPPHRAGRPARHRPPARRRAADALPRRSASPRRSPTRCSTSPCAGRSAPRGANAARAGAHRGRQHAGQPPADLRRPRVAPACCASTRMGAVVYVLTLGLTDRRARRPARARPAPATGVELTVLVAASICATVTRYVALRTWVFARGGGPASCAAAPARADPSLTPARPARPPPYRGRGVPDRRAARPPGGAHRSATSTACGGAWSACAAATTRRPAARRSPACSPTSRTPRRASPPAAPPCRRSPTRPSCRSARGARTCWPRSRDHQVVVVAGRDRLGQDHAAAEDLPRARARDPRRDRAHPAAAAGRAHGRRAHRRRAGVAARRAPSATPCASTTARARTRWSGW